MTLALERKIVSLVGNAEEPGCPGSSLAHELCMSVGLSLAVTTCRPTKSKDSQTGLLCQSANYASEPVIHS